MEEEDLQRFEQAVKDFDNAITRLDSILSPTLEGLDDLTERWERIAGLRPPKDEERRRATEAHGDLMRRLQARRDPNE